jgi:hypothetical protein
VIGYACKIHRYWGTTEIQTHPTERPPAQRFAYRKPVSFSYPVITERTYLSTQHSSIDVGIETIYINAQKLNKSHL